MLTVLCCIRFTSSFIRGRKNYNEIRTALRVDGLQSSYVKCIYKLMIDKKEYAT